MQTRPELDQKVTLCTQDGVEITSYVRGILIDGFVLAHPVDLPAEHPFHEGADLLLVWHAVGGRYTVACQLVVISHHGARAWEVCITGGLERLQRRAYVRAAVPGTITMYWNNKLHVPRSLSANVDDLSEASVRFVTNNRSVLVEDMTDKPVRVGLEVVDRKFDIHGKVLRIVRFDPLTQQVLASAEESASDTWAVYLLFVDHGRAADELRRIVYQAQLRARQGLV